MPSKQRIRVRRRRRRHWWQYLGAKFWYALVVLCFLIAIYLYSQGGLRLQSGQNASPPGEILRVEQDSILELEYQFLDLMEEGAVTKASIAILEDAIRRQSDLVYYLGVGSKAEIEGRDILNRLVKLRDTEAGRIERALSERAEMEAVSASLSGRNEFAMMAYDDAIAAQERINRYYIHSPFADRNRVNELRVARQRLEAAPFARSARALESEALQALYEQRYEEAEQKLSLAILHTRRILQEFSDTLLVRQEDLVRLESLLEEARAGQSQSGL